MTWTLLSAPELSDEEFRRWRGLLETRSGISLSEHQKQFLHSQVTMRMRELGEDQFSSYMKRVIDPHAGRLEWSILLDRLLVKETSFFRHQPSFDFVCGELQNRINNSSLDASFDVWSLGCSTGEEAYSLIMLINESFELAKCDRFFSVNATDVSRVAISLARSAQYSARKLEFVQPALRAKYFNECGRDQYVFDHRIKDKVCFSTANILKPEEMPPLRFDVVFCQNLLVYFKQSLRKRVLDSVVEKLKPGALLVIGLGEIINWSNPLLERVGRSDVQAYIRKRQ